MKKAQFTAALMEMLMTAAMRSPRGSKGRAIGADIIDEDEDGDDDAVVAATRIWWVAMTAIEALVAVVGPFCAAVAKVVSVSMMRTAFLNALS